MNQTERLNLRLSPDQKNEISRCAANAGCTISEYMLRCALSAEMKKSAYKISIELDAEELSIVRNLAKYYNVSIEKRLEDLLHWAIWYYSPSSNIKDIKGR